MLPRARAFKAAYRRLQRGGDGAGRFVVAAPTGEEMHRWQKDADDHHRTLMRLNSLPLQQDCDCVASTMKCDYCSALDGAQDLMDCFHCTVQADPGCACAAVTN